MFITKLKNFSPQIWSKLFDLLIVIGDYLIGSVLLHVLFPYFDPNSTGWEHSSMAFNISLIFIFLTIAYVLGLIINRVNFIAEGPIRFSGGDNIAMLFNMVAFSAMFPVLLMRVLPVLINMYVVIFLVFALMIFWIWIHWYVIRKIDHSEKLKSSIKRKIVGFLLVFPFTMAIMLPINSLSESLAFDSLQGYSDLSKNLWLPLITGFLLAILGWTMAFIPRKMLKAFVGIDYKSRYFFWTLVLTYVLRLSPIGLL